MTVRVDPDDMVQYVQTVDCRSAARRAAVGRRYGARARRAAALERAQSRFRRSPREPWMTPQKRAQYHVPAALIAAAGVARLTMSEDEVVFDIPTLLDATLQLCEPGGPRLSRRLDGRSLGQHAADVG